MTVNGVPYMGTVEPRTLLIDFLRDDLGIAGPKIGCIEGKCGACTVILNGVSVLSCMIFAVQADGADILTVEGLSDGSKLHLIQEAFKENFAVQCGYCSPGMVMSTYQLLKRNLNPTEEAIKDAISGNLCRCSGYLSIINAVKDAAKKMREQG